MLCELKGVGRRALLAPFEILHPDSHLTVESNFILALNLDFSKQACQISKRKFDLKMAAGLRALFSSVCDLAWRWLLTKNTLLEGVF